MAAAAEVFILGFAFGFACGRFGERAGPCNRFVFVLFWIVVLELVKVVATLFLRVLCIDFRADLLLRSSAFSLRVFGTGWVGVRYCLDRVDVGFNGGCFVVEKIG